MKKVYLSCLCIGVIALFSAGFMSSMHKHGWRDINTLAHIFLLIAIILLPFVQERNEETEGKPTQRIFNVTNVGSFGAALLFIGMLMHDFRIYGHGYFKLAGTVIVLVVLIIVGVGRLRRKN